MEPLLRVERSPDAESDLLGYAWIDVLAIEPRALAIPGEGYGDWCDRLISNWYICLTPNGLTRITSDDFWTAVEENEEYSLRAESAVRQ
ncbi:hypothetical protein VM98_03085 [Streptomyces rubellomurinus subsp. indigoferus]|nr:hypothetical protein VM98_03085 [Streptomyces rubellomurinus subsp. indigoferus]